ncbi:unnamed protein product [Lactuca saligna]|uniref:Uncharacterized protein n=1 Tax=Lactuca saligna TaxID=75948 RepID=A0AA35YXX3_LACSI|nr:unnamed protein product [Lactuca saligna]
MENYRTTYNNNTISTNEALKHLGEMFKTEKLNIEQIRTDVTSLLLDIIETKDSMISITVRKHLAERLNPVFAILYHLEGVSPQSSDQKQGGEGVSKAEHPKFLPSLLSRKNLTARKN